MSGDLFHKKIYLPRCKITIFYIYYQLITFHSFVLPFCRYLSRNCQSISVNKNFNCFINRNSGHFWPNPTTASTKYFEWDHHQRSNEHLYFSLFCFVTVTSLRFQTNIHRNEYFCSKGGVGGYLLCDVIEFFSCPQIEIFWAKNVGHCCCPLEISD